MNYMDSNKIGQRIENKLIHTLGRTISEATNDVGSVDLSLD